MSNEPRPLNYILENRVPVPVQTSDILVWGQWFEDFENRRVAQDWVHGVQVSTVFLGIDHAYHGEVPLLFETMTFGKPLDEECWRCATWDQAETQHDLACKQVSEAVRVLRMGYRRFKKNTIRCTPEKLQPQMRQTLRKDGRTLFSYYKRPERIVRAVFPDAYLQPA